MIHTHNFADVVFPTIKICIIRQKQKDMGLYFIQQFYVILFELHFLICHRICSVEVNILKYVDWNVFWKPSFDFIDKYEEARQMKYFEQKVTKMLLQQNNSAHVYKSIFIILFICLNQMRFYALPFCDFWSIFISTKLISNETLCLQCLAKINPQYRYPIIDFFEGKSYPACYCNTLLLCG